MTRKPMACYGCKEPDGLVEAYDLTTADFGDSEVNYLFRERTDACIPVMRRVYEIIEAQRLAAQAAGNPFTDNTVLQMYVRPDANRHERWTNEHPRIARLPMVAPVADYFYDRGPCEVEFYRRYEAGQPQAAPAQPQPRGQPNIRHIRVVRPQP